MSHKILVIVHLLKRQRSDHGELAEADQQGREGRQDSARDAKRSHSDGLVPNKLLRLYLLLLLK